MSRGMIKAPMFLPPMGHGFGGGMPMMPPLPGGPPHMPNMPPQPPRQPSLPIGQEAGAGQMANGMMPGQGAVQVQPMHQAGFGPGPQIAFQMNPGQAPFQLNHGQVPYQANLGQMPAVGAPGFAPTVPMGAAPAFQAGMGLPFLPGFPGQPFPPNPQPDIPGHPETVGLAQAAEAGVQATAAPPDTAQRTQFRRPGMYSTRQADLQYTART